MQESKTDKHNCPVTASPELIKLLDEEKHKTQLFREEIAERAIMQLLRPFKYQLGIGHKDFRFLAPVKAGKNNKTIQFWIKKNLWERIKQTSLEHNVSLKAIMHTALHNYLVLPTQQK